MVIMERLSVNDSIKIIDNLIINYPDLRNLLELQKQILIAQRRIRESPNKGTNINWEESHFIISNLQESIRKSNKPLINFLNPSIFNFDELLNTFNQVIEVLSKIIVKKDDLLKNLSNELIKDIEALITAYLKNDEDFFINYSKKLNISPTLIIFIINILIQPCFEEIANRIDSSILENWWQAPCPICGRKPIVAKLKNRKRYLICSLCNVEYLADLFLCVNCGNIDPATFKFLTPENHSEFRVDFCEKCKHYIKVIDEEKLKKPIPKGFEDILTIDLDIMAEKAGLIRD
ncbi:MAG: formate dehydrogenase accessory protein FdhE [Nitrososphaerales archaeon]